MQRAIPFVIAVLSLGLSAAWAAPSANPTQPNPANRQALAAAAQRIDQLVEAGYRKHDLRPSPLTDDNTFLRRVYLDLAGRIPTYDEALPFLNSKQPDKRQALIDRLVESEAYASHTYNFWADVLRIKTQLDNKVFGGPYTDWVKTAIRSNMPYDQFVYQMMTAEGRLRDDGAAGYMIRDSGMPLDAMSNTVRVFLGTRIGCAQCHDHPFDKWTQREFYELAAYTFGTSTRDGKFNKPGLRRMAMEQNLSQREQGILQRLVRSESYAVKDTGKMLKLPEDYKYKDAKPGDPVEPHTIFGSPAVPSQGQTPRQALAAWMTSPDNPRFTCVIANRLWKRMLGAGLVEPVDDFTDDTQASNPQLLEFLTQQMRALKYDTKAFTRMIAYTKTYQREVTRVELKPTEPYHFPGPILRRMSAEQIWDSLLTLVVPDLDQRVGISDLAQQYGASVDISTMSPEQVIAYAKEMAAKPRPEAMIKAKNFEKAMDRRGTDAQGFPPTFVRASEWISPARPGTFLEQFGASDREILDSATTDPTVAQALALLNGEMPQAILSPRSAMAKKIEQAPTPEAKIRILFMSVLGRQPSPTDLQVCLAEIKSNPRQGLQNIAWALLNTREFLFVQ